MKGLLEKAMEEDKKFEEWNDKSRLDRGNDDWAKNWGFASAHNSLYTTLISLLTKESRFYESEKLEIYKNILNYIDYTGEADLKG